MNRLSFISPFTFAPTERFAVSQQSSENLTIMKYTKLVFALLSSLCLCATLHAGMQDRGYAEVLIDDVTHPNNGQIRLAVGPEGRVYISYSNTYDEATQTNIDGWIEVYSAAGALQATITGADVPSVGVNDTFAPYDVLPGPGGIFAISHGSGTAVFGSDLQHYRDTGFIGGSQARGWTQSLDGGFVTFDVSNNFSASNSQVFRRVRDASGTLLESESFTFGDILSDDEWLVAGYSLVVDVYNSFPGYFADELIFSVDGTLLSRGEVDGPYDRPTFENSQVAATRRAYRTKGDANAIPLPRIVSVAQVPDTTLVNITYRVEDADNETVTVGILASLTDGEGQTSRLPLATLVNDTAANLGAAVPTNTELTVTWDAGVDWGAAFGDVSFDIYANDARPLLGFHMLTLPLAEGDLSISRSPVNDLELKEAVYYLWATNQGVRLDADNQLVGQGGLFEGVLLGTPEAPVTAASRSLVFYQLGLQEASAAQVQAARNGFDADTVYQFTPKNPISGDLLKSFSFYSTSGGQFVTAQLPYYVNELGFDSVAPQSEDLWAGIIDRPLWWVVPGTPRVLQSSVAVPAGGGDFTLTILDPSNQGWSLATTSNWLSISSATSGVGSALITLSAAENTDINTRSGTVALNGAALSVSVTQGGDPDLFPDDFANRYTLSGTSGAVEVNNASATLEAGEPSHYYGSGAYSLWFSFTAPANGQLTLSVDSLAEGYTEEYISIYSGTELAALSKQDDWFRSATLGMTANQTYQIAITSYFGYAPSDLNISYQFTADAE